jgi:RNA polymerase sigma factor (sigma-70 family)
MEKDESQRTSATLLGKLRRDPKDEIAWVDFVARYRPLILAWSRGWRLQDSDAEDVTQAVLLKLNRLMPTFVYDPAGSFRGWLRTLARHAWHDLVSERRRIATAKSNTHLDDLFENARAGDDLVEQIEQEFRRELMDQAVALVRPRVAARSWDAFRLTALEGQTGATAAAQLGMTIARVYVAKSEIKKMIQDQVRRLEASE